MNPMLIAQGVSAVTGLVGSLIPDEEKTVMHTTQTQGSQMAGRVSGALGSTTQKTFTQETEQSDLKKGLLKVSAISGAVGSLGGMLKPNMNVGSGEGSGLIRGISDLAGSVFKTNQALNDTAPATTSAVNPGMTDTDISNLQDVLTPELLSKIRLH